nr:MAG TPA: hypothetical protein [Caudoviricetes sp.]
MAEIIIIRESDLDNNTIKVVNKKVTVPGAEIAVLDSYDLQDTDTHYVEKKDKYLKHVETGAVWPASISVMKERAAPRNEELTTDSVVTFGMPDSEIAVISVSPRSAISNRYHPSVKKDIGDIVGGTGIFAQYANAKEANAALANEKLTFTTNEYFADNIEGKPKILATTFELPYPELPYKEGKADVKLVGQSFDGSVDLRFADSVLQTKQRNIEKTYHYKFVSVTGQEYEGTFKGTEYHVSVKDCEPSIEWYQIARATYSVEPFNVEYFFGNEEVAPAAVTVENLVDHL